MEHTDFDNNIILTINNAIDNNKNIYNYPLNIYDLQKNYEIFKKSQNNIMKIGQRYNIESDLLLYVFLVYRNSKYYQVIFNNNNNFVSYIAEI
jgi:hypothetical protein